MDDVTSRIVIVLVAIVGCVCGSTFTANIISDVNQTATTNTTVVLPCLTLAPGPVRWCYHKTPESECDEVAFNGRIVNGHAVYYELHANNLTVKSATPDFDGAYMCIEENGQGDWHRIHLTIQDEVILEVPDNDATNVVVAEAGQAVTLSCPAGSPPFNWLYRYSRHVAGEQARDDVVVNHRDRFSIDPSKPNELFINDVLYSDAGQYTCVERAGFGPLRSTIILSVEGDALRAAAYDSPSNRLYLTLFAISAVLLVFASIVGTVSLMFYCRLRATKNAAHENDAEKAPLMIGSNAANLTEVENLLDEYIPKDTSSAKSWTGDKFMFAVVRQPVLFKACTDALEYHVKSLAIDAIVGIYANDSRADLFAVPIAQRLGKPYIPIVAAEKRTAENIEQKTYRSRFNKVTTIELEKGPQWSNIKNVVLIDSYLLTGKSTAAAVELIETGLEANVVECIVVVAPKKEVKRKFGAKVWSMLKNDKLDKALVDNEDE